MLQIFLLFSKCTWTFCVLCITCVGLYNIYTCIYLMIFSSWSSRHRAVGFVNHWATSGVPRYLWYIRGKRNEWGNGWRENGKKLGSIYCLLQVLYLCKGMDQKYGSLLPIRQRKEVNIIGYKVTWGKSKPIYQKKQSVSWKTCENPWAWMRWKNILLL